MNSTQVFNHCQDLEAQSTLAHRKVLFAICPTGAYCREDRCQSYFKFDLIPTMRAPLEECESAGAIRAAGSKAVVLDAAAARLSAEEFIKQVTAITPDLVILVTTFGTLDADLAWAPKIRAILPGVPIGLRGAPCYVMSDSILNRAPQLDFCVKGEYEIIFDSVVRFGYENSPGTIYRKDGNIFTSENIPRVDNLDDLPFPDRTAIDQKLYAVRGLRQPQATVRVQRGCPYPCTYCLVHTVSGSKARHRSPMSIVREIKEIIATGITCFYFRAETFTLNREWAMATCEALTQHCPGIRWVTTTRVERVDNELLAAMRRSGCYGLSFGLDIVSPSIAHHVRKKADLEVASEALKLCDRHGIISLAYVMIGFIWDTPETLKEASAFLKKIKPDLLTVHFAHPYPGTKYYEDFKNSNGKVISLHAQAEPATTCPGVTAAELKRHANRMLLSHYSRPRVLATLLRKGTNLLLRH